MTHFSFLISTDLEAGEHALAQAASNYLSMGQWELAQASLRVLARTGTANARSKVASILQTLVDGPPPHWLRSRSIPAAAHLQWLALMELRHLASTSEDVVIEEEDDSHYRAIEFDVLLETINMRDIPLLSEEVLLELHRLRAIVWGLYGEVDSEVDLSTKAVEQIRSVALSSPVLVNALYTELVGPPSLLTIGASRRMVGGPAGIAVRTAVKVSSVLQHLFADVITEKIRLLIDRQEDNVDGLYALLRCIRDVKNVDGRKALLGSLSAFASIAAHGDPDEWDDQSSVALHEIYQALLSSPSSQTTSLRGFLRQLDRQTRTSAGGGLPPAYLRAVEANEPVPWKAVFTWSRVTGNHLLESVLLESLDAISKGNLKEASLILRPLPQLRPLVLILSWDKFDIEKRQQLLETMMDESGDTRIDSICEELQYQLKVAWWCTGRLLPSTSDDEQRLSVAGAVLDSLDDHSIPGIMQTSLPTFTPSEIVELIQSKPTKSEDEDEEKERDLAVLKGFNVIQSISSLYTARMMGSIVEVEEAFVEAKQNLLAITGRVSILENLFLMLFLKTKDSNQPTTTTDTFIAWPKMITSTLDLLLEVINDEIVDERTSLLRARCEEMQWRLAMCDHLKMLDKIGTIHAVLSPPESLLAVAVRRGDWISCSKIVQFFNLPESVTTDATMAEAFQKISTEWTTESIPQALAGIMADKSPSESQCSLLIDVAITTAPTNKACMDLLNHVKPETELVAHLKSLCSTKPHKPLKEIIVQTRQSSALPATVSQLWSVVNRDPGQQLNALVDDLKHANSPHPFLSLFLSHALAICNIIDDDDGRKSWIAVAKAIGDTPSNLIAQLVLNDAIDKAESLASKMHISFDAVIMNMIGTHKLTPTIINYLIDKRPMVALLVLLSDTAEDHTIQLTTIAQYHPSLYRWITARATSLHLINGHVSHPATVVAPASEHAEQHFLLSYPSKEPSGSALTSALQMKQAESTPVVSGTLSHDWSAQPGPLFGMLAPRDAPILISRKQQHGFELVSTSLVNEAPLSRMAALSTSLAAGHPKMQIQEPPETQAPSLPAMELLPGEAFPSEHDVLKIVDWLVAQDRFVDALNFSDRYLNEGAPDAVLEPLILRARSRRDTWRFIVRLKDNTLAAQLALEHMQAWSVQVCVDVLGKIARHLSKSTLAPTNEPLIAIPMTKAQPGSLHATIQSKSVQVSIYRDIMLASDRWSKWQLVANACGEDLANVVTWLIELTKFDLARRVVKQFNGGSSLLKSIESEFLLHLLQPLEIVDEAPVQPEQPEAPDSPQGFKSDSSDASDSDDDGGVLSDDEILPQVVHSDASLLPLGSADRTELLLTPHGGGALVSGMAAAAKVAAALPETVLVDQMSEHGPRPGAFAAAATAAAVDRGPSVHGRIVHILSTFDVSFAQSVTVSVLKRVRALRTRLVLLHFLLSSTESSKPQMKRWMDERLGTRVLMLLPSALKQRFRQMAKHPFLILENLLMSAEISQASKLLQALPDLVSDGLVAQYAHKAVLDSVSDDVDVGEWSLDAFTAEPALRRISLDRWTLRCAPDGLDLSDDEGSEVVPPWEAHNARIRESHHFPPPPTPSADLPRALLDLVRDHVFAGTSAIAACDALSQTDVNPSVIADMIRQLLFYAKFRFMRGGDPGGVDQCESYLVRVDLLRMIDTAGIAFQVTLDDLTSAIRARKLRDRLVLSDRMQVAVDVATKCGVEAEPVWAAWGLDLIRLGHYGDARAKLSHCLVPAVANPTKGVARSLSFGGSGQASPASRQAMPLMDRTRLLKEIVGLLEGLPPVDRSGLTSLYRDLSQSGGRVVQHDTDDIEEEGALSVESFLRVLSVSTPTKATAPSTPSRITTKSTLDSTRYAECVHYLRQYGSQRDLVAFWMRHGRVVDALHFVLDKQLPESIWIEEMALPACESSHRLKELLGVLRGIDTSLSTTSPLLLSLCRALSLQQNYSRLYSVQTFMSDNVRAGLTCVKLAQQATAPDARIGFLERAKEHLLDGLIQSQKQSRGSSSSWFPWLSSPAAPSSSPAFTSASESDVARLLKTVTLQLEVTRLFAQQRSEASAAVSVLNCTGKETLFGRGNERQKVAEQVLLIGEFGLGFRIVQEYHLPLAPLYAAVAGSMAKRNQARRLSDLFRNVKGTVPEADFDLIVLAAIHSYAKEANDVKSAERLVTRLSDETAKVKALIECGKLKAAYLTAVRVGDVDSVNLIREAAMALEEGPDAGRGRVVLGLCDSFMKKKGVE